MPETLSPAAAPSCAPATQAFRHRCFVCIITDPAGNESVADVSTTRRDADAFAEPFNRLDRSGHVVTVHEASAAIFLK